MLLTLPLSSVKVSFRLPTVSLDIGCLALFRYAMPRLPVTQPLISKGFNVVNTTRKNGHQTKRLMAIGVKYHAVVPVFTGEHCSQSMIFCSSLVAPGRVSRQQATSSIIQIVPISRRPPTAEKAG